MHYNSNPKKKRQSSLGSDGERTDDDSLSCGGDDMSPSNSPNNVRVLDGDEAVGRLYGDRQLKFSVDNILRPDFGCRSRSLMIASCIKSHSFAPLSSPASEVSSALSKSFPDFASSNSISVPNLPPVLWPAWVYCTRYSDRPSSGPRSRRARRKTKGTEKRPRTAFTSRQLDRLRCEFQQNRYLTEKRRQELACELGLNESQIKIWFQNKRAKIKKQTRCNNALAVQLMAQGLYNHTVPTVPTTSVSANDDDDEMSDLEIETVC